MAVSPLCSMVVLPVDNSRARPHNGAVGDKQLKEFGQRLRRRREAPHLTRPALCDGGGLTRTPVRPLRSSQPPLWRRPPGGSGGAAPPPPPARPPPAQRKNGGRGGGAPPKGGPPATRGGGGPGGTNRRPGGTHFPRPGGGPADRAPPTNSPP